MLGWNAGNFHWNVSVFGFAPTGDYSTRQLANASLNRWAVMPRFAATYFDPKSGWQMNGVAVYTINFENPDTNYDSGDILNLEGSILKNFGPLGVGAVGYAMIQTTADSGEGARLGANEFARLRRWTNPDLCFRQASQSSDIHRQGIPRVRG